MDPNANLQEQERILQQPLYERPHHAQVRLRELRQALTGWLSAGGFEPDWSDCPNAARYYKKEA